MSATAFAWKSVNGARYDPPGDPRVYGSDSRCWLCGGPTHGIGWPRRVAFTELFTDAKLARVPSSDTACQPCVAMSRKDTWEAYVAAHPEMGLKTGQTMSWRNYGHAFWTNHHECPNRSRWRALLIDPPEPPFVFVIAESAQKHLVFRASIAYDREVFPAQVEDETIIIRRRQFADCLLAFERVYALGFSKDQIVSGRYHQAQVMKSGLTLWREAETAFAPFRRLRPHDVRISAYVAQREDAS